MKNKLSGKNILKRIDWLLVAIVFVLVLMGVIAIMSATVPAYSDEEMTFAEYMSSLDYSYAGLQLGFFGISILVVVVILFIDYNNLRDFSNIIYWVAVAMLVAVLIFGSNQRGMVGWFMIGSRGFQPGEFCKIAIIIVLAKELAQQTEGKNDGIQRFRDVWPLVWKFAIPFVLILMQPDWGTAIVYAFIFAGMLFMAKTSFKILGTFLAGALALLPIGWLLMTPDQQKRILVFLDPTKDPEGAGFQVLRSKIVGSSGGLNGKGFFSEDLLTQQSNYLPDNHTDFIFSSTIEAIGLIGGILLILLYLFLILRMVQLSMRAKDDFGCYIVIGVSFMLLFHIFENIGMNIGLMPVTGIPLPLFSYGGSNILTIMIAIGFVLNVNMRRVRYGSLGGNV